MDLVKTVMKAVQMALNKLIDFASGSDDGSSFRRTNLIWTRGSQVPMTFLGGWHTWALSSQATILQFAGLSKLEVIELDVLVPYCSSRCNKFSMHRQTF